MVYQSYCRDLSQDSLLPFTLDIIACPYSDPSLSKAVDVQPRPELLAFTTDSALQWKLYNSTYITTMAVFGNLTLDPQVR